MLAFLLMLAGPPGVAAQQLDDRAAPRRPGQRPGRPALGAARRQMLQQRIFARFMDRATVRLGLTADGRQRLEQVVLTNEGQRRELARQARALRSELARASADANTPDSQFDRLLRQMGELRARELDLWRSEQTDLAGVLTPRQRAQFLAMRLEFFEMVQRARQAR